MTDHDDDDYPPFDLEAETASIRQLLYEQHAQIAALRREVRSLRSGVTRILRAVQPPSGAEGEVEDGD